ncbi:hypothetical protein D3C78_1108800 [compost metagenome]
MLAQLQGGFLNGHAGLASRNHYVTVDRRAAVGRITVRVAVGEGGIIQANGAGLVAGHVAGHQAQANDEAVVGGVVVTGGGGDGKGKPRVNTVSAQRA